MNLMLVELWYRVDTGVIAIKKYTTLFRTEFPRPVAVYFLVLYSPTLFLTETRRREYCRRILNEADRARIYSFSHKILGKTCVISIGIVITTEQDLCRF